MERMGEKTKIEQNSAHLTDSQISDEVKYTLWDRIVDFFYFNDYYIVILILSLLLIYWALK